MQTFVFDAVSKLQFFQHTVQILSASFETKSGKKLFEVFIYDAMQCKKVILVIALTRMDVYAKRGGWFSAERFTMILCGPNFVVTCCKRLEVTGDSFAIS